MDGFDLDLTYMGEDDRIVAMGFPSESMEAAYRNPMKEVLKLLDTKHKDHYKVYNLCSERGYDIEKFHNRVGLYPFDDHNAPAFEMIHSFCQDVADWLAEDKQNIAVIHCKAGKGRTGLMICAWFLFSRMWPTPDDALKYYALARTYDQKGVTIPSQLRYVRYFHESLNMPEKYVARPLLLHKVVFHTIPKTVDVNDIDFKLYASRLVQVGEEKALTQLKTENFHYKGYVEGAKLKDEPKITKVDKKKKKKDKKNKEKEKGSAGYAADANGKAEPEKEMLDTIEFDVGGPAGVPVCGDVKMDFEAKGGRMFMFWFNTFFVKDGRMVIGKGGLDKASKDVKHHSKYEPEFCVELQFSEMTEEIPTRKLTTVGSSSSIPTTATSTATSISSTSAPSSPISNGNHPKVLQGSSSGNF